SSYRVNAAYHIKYTWNTYYGFEDIFGRTATISSEYLDYLGNMKNGDNFFKLLNVKYLVQPEDLEIDSSVFRKCISENNNILYEFKNFLPRFTAVKRARFCNDKNEIYNIISNDTGFVPETEILFLNEDKSVCDNINSDMTLNSHINIIENNNNAIKLKIENSSPALILWSNKFSEDWQIFVNSQKTKMYRANWIFSCFKIPAGKNIVELKYSPVIYKISLLLTCAGLILSLLFLIFKF
ncbi:YfhO family protein, partial [Candidatus Dependentiae bacterium]|nr:YfhO family protein [Candidatus Dependentiae bacterium]